MISTLSKTFFGLTVLLYIFASTVNATCTCHEVCPTYEKDGSCWEERATCPTDHITDCTPGIPFIRDPVCHTCKSGCVCNVFGCNCDGCMCGSGRNLRGLLEEEAKDVDPCEDFNEYMAMSHEDKQSHLSEKHCKGNNAFGNIVSILETLADADKNGDFTCEEFNAAYFDVRGVALCEDN